MENLFHSNDKLNKKKKNNKTASRLKNFSQINNCSQRDVTYADYQGNWILCIMLQYSVIFNDHIDYIFLHYILSGATQLLSNIIRPTACVSIHSNNQARRK